MIAPGIQEAVLPLDLLRANEEASVVELIGESSQVHRLAEMGLRPGVSVRMVRPGAPCLLALDGKRLSIRLSGNVEVLVASAIPA
ncbi:MAG: ferrous iron transport protein A [Planctomycetales bacterium]|nr:ferrous iron transport protein A [Planctomycetales bacterium]